MQRRHSFRKYLQIVPIILVVLFILVVACGSSGEPDGDHVTGEVIGVEERSLTEFESLSLIDDDGKVWEFTGGSFVGFTPSHLREHQALGDPVKVWFVREGELLRVTRIEDGS